MKTFSELVDIMEVLRSKEGCPWDRVQTLTTLRGYLIEEAYEVLEMIDSGNFQGLKEELGDLLFEIIFIAKIASDRGEFSIHDVLVEIKEKMIRRHPHVFGDGKADTPDQVSTNWRRIKLTQENKRYKSLLDGLPETLPALFMAHQLSKRAARANFDWDSIEKIIDKLQEEVEEFREAWERNNMEEMEDEVGDILFAGANIARFMGINPEIALIKANRRFKERFRYMEEVLERQGLEMETREIDELEALWEESKKR